MGLQSRTAQAPYNYTIPVQVDREGGKTRLAVTLWDTGGGEDYHRLRPLSYPQTDIFLLCFDITSRRMFEGLCSYWLPELDLHMPDTPRLLVGCKADLRDDEEKYPDIVSYSEAREEAQRLGMEYFETSSLRNKGLDQCFQRAWQLAIQGYEERQRQKTLQKKLMSSLSRKSGRKLKERRPSLNLPPKPRTPEITVEETHFHEDWQKSYDDSIHSGVMFLFESSKRQVKAHKVLLCAASDFFCKLFGVTTDPKKSKKESPELSQSDEVSPDCQKAVSRIYTEDVDGRRLTMVVLQPDIKELYFTYLIKFCYTGSPQIPADATPYDIEQTIQISQVFHIPELEVFCKNIQDEDTELNPSIQDYHIKHVGDRSKTMFLNNSTFSDVSFKIDGNNIFAHKSVLSARSDVLAAMFSGNYAESQTEMSEVNIVDTPLEPFLALLEYLYTDRLSSECDTQAVLVLADQYCLPRLLALCEAAISKEIMGMAEKGSKNYQANVFDLVTFSKTHNATELQSWLILFMAINYADFHSHKDFSSLDDEAIEYIKEHQWPPPEFTDEMKERKEELNKWYPRYRYNRRKCVLL